MSSILHRSSYMLTGFILGAGFLMLISYTMAFTEPTMAPPLDNAAPPLNTSPTPQIKQGPLSAAGNIVNTAPLSGWLGLTGDLPGYTLNQYPTLKTNGGYIYLSTENQIRGWIGGSYSGLGTNYLEIRDPLLNTTNAQIAGISANNTFFANTGGNVGIGTSNPLQKLHVAGNIAATNIYSADVYSSANGGAWMSQLCRSNGTNCPAGSMVWGINGSSIYNINSGNVGIGINNPSAKLHVNGNAFFDLPLGTSPERHLTIKNAGTIQMPFGSYPGAWTPALQIQNNNNTRFIWLSPLDSASLGNARLVTIGSDFDIMPNNTSEPFKFTSSGDLSVYGNIQSRTLGASLSQMCSTLNLTLQANCPGSAWGTSGTNVYVANNISVGIGTSNPSAKLHVVGPAIFDNPGGAIRVLGTPGALGNNDLGIWEKVNADVYAIADWTTGTKGIFIDTGSSGNVGIGTDNPYNKLHVAGSIGATGWIGAGCETACNYAGGYGIIYPDGRLVMTGTASIYLGGTENTIQMNGAVIKGVANTYWGIGQKSGQVFYPGMLDIATDYQTSYYLASQSSSGGLYTNGTFTAGGAIKTAADALGNYPDVSGGRFADANDNTYFVDPNGVSRVGGITQIVDGHSIELTTINSNYLGYIIDGNPFGVSTWASSKRFKTNIADLDFNSDRIYELQPVNFNWISERGGERDFGLIAEEVEKVFPLLVSYDSAGKPFSVKYELLSVLLLDELKNKKSEIDALKKDIEILKAKFAP